MAVLAAVLTTVLAAFPADLPHLIHGAVEASPLLGYGAITLVMLLENVVPPIPSELVLPLAGYLVYRGELALLPAVLAALLGTVLGAWFWYGIGRLVPAERLEQWLERHGQRLGLVAADLTRSRRWFTAHGPALVFWGRMVPGLRTLISVPAGLERMPQLVFLAWTTAGSLIWTTALILAGRGLGQGYGQVAGWLGPFAHSVEWALGLALLAGVVVLVIRATTHR